MKTRTKEAHVYFPLKVFAELVKLAGRNRRSLTAEIIIAVEERIKKENASR